MNKLLSSIKELHCQIYVIIIRLAKCVKEVTRFITCIVLWIGILTSKFYSKFIK